MDGPNVSIARHWWATEVVSAWAWENSSPAWRDSVLKGLYENPFTQRQRFSIQPAHRGHGLIPLLHLHVTFSSRCTSIFEEGHIVLRGNLFRSCLCPCMHKELTRGYYGRRKLEIISLLRPSSSMWAVQFEPVEAELTENVSSEPSTSWSLEGSRALATVLWAARQSDTTMSGKQRKLHDSAVQKKEKQIHCFNDSKCFLR